MEFLILLALIFTNAFFVLAEQSIIIASDSRLNKSAGNGSEGAATAIQLKNNPTTFLSTVGMGITTIAIVSGYLGESILAGPIETLLALCNVPEKMIPGSASVLSVVIITYLSIVFGELIPKRLAMIYPVQLAAFTAKPIRYFSMLMSPLVIILSYSTKGVLKVFGFGPSIENAVTDDDIRAVLAEGSESGLIDQEEHNVVSNVLELEDRYITSLMIPASSAIYLDTTKNIEDNMALISQSPHSRFPVCDGSFNNVIGVVTTKALLAKMVLSEEIDLAAMAEACPTAPETLTALELLKLFRDTDTGMVFITSEYGEITGVVSLKDLVEAMAGEFAPIDARDAFVIEGEDGSFTLDGRLPTLDLMKRLGIEKLPDNDEYDTLTGLAMTVLSRISSAGDIFTVCGWSIEVLSMDGRRIDKARATKVTA